MKLNTHLKIDNSLCGSISALEEGRAEVTLQTTDAMAADKHGLVHGGFIFGAADYAAMAAVNDPNVVLGSADVKFIKATRTGETVVLSASVVESKGKRRQVEVLGSDAHSNRMFSGVFQCFVLEKHILGE